MHQIQSQENTDEVKSQNETTARIASADSSAAATPSADVSNASSWEDMKQAMLDEMEGGGQPSQVAPSSPELLESVEKSEQLLHQKNETIQELQSLLEKRESDQASPVDEESQEAEKKILDENEVIANEQQRLSELQEYWQEKIGRAEIELSQERARLARERIVLDEQKELMEQNQEAGELPETPRGRKWREHLGLD